MNLPKNLSTTIETLIPGFILKIHPTQRTDFYHAEALCFDSKGKVTTKAPMTLGGITLFFLTLGAPLHQARWIDSVTGDFVALSIL